MNAKTENIQVVMPAGWCSEAQIHWVKGEKTAAIQALIADLNTYPQGEKPNPKILQLAYYLYLIGDYGSVVKVLEPLAETTANPEILLNLAVAYRRTNRYADAVQAAKRTLTLRPCEAVAYDALATSYFELKQWAQASDAGTQSLIIKDQNANPADPNWHFPLTTPAEFATQNGKKNVISFSLWGNHPRYLRGALRNLLLAPDMYPDWTLRFYVDNTVPAEFVGLMRELGGEVRVQAPNRPLKEKLCWRFWVANDSTVGYFLVRDIDSAFSVREVNAVDEWRHSEKWFHLIRDWWSHTDLILAGLWGGVAGVLPDLAQMLSNYEPKTMETPNVDQWFLRDQVWGYLRQSLLMHDRCFHLPDTVRLSPPTTDCHIGQNEFILSSQEKILRAWIKQYPCLQIPDHH